jgi:hypothetical protein
MSSVLFDIKKNYDVNKTASGMGFACIKETPYLTHPCAVNYSQI